VDLAPEALRGETVCHCDLRADNALVDGDRCVFVDWNWVSVGPAWTDFVGVLPLARADGVDVDAWVRRSPLTRHVEPEQIDSWLAVIIAYMLSVADEPPWPGGTPAIREHQRRYARTFADWLAVRRGWV
jgi:thiamine kinase-like enzyme